MGYDALQCREGMSYVLANGLSCRFWYMIKPCLHVIEHPFVLPSLHALTLSRCASGLKRGRQTRI